MITRRENQTEIKHTFERRHAAIAFAKKVVALYFSGSAHFARPLQTFRDRNNFEIGAMRSESRISLHSKLFFRNALIPVILNRRNVAYERAENVKSQCAPLARAEVMVTISCLIFSQSSG